MEVGGACDKLGGAGWTDAEEEGDASRCRSVQEEPVPNPTYLGATLSEPLSTPPGNTPDSGQSKTKQGTERTEKRVRLSPKYHDEELYELKSPRVMRLIFKRIKSLF